MARRELFGRSPVNRFKETPLPQKSKERGVSPWVPSGTGEPVNRRNPDAAMDEDLFWALTHRLPDPIHDPDRVVFVSRFKLRDSPK